MKKSRNIFILFLQVAVLIIFSTHVAYAESLDSQGTSSISLKISSPAESELSIKGHERHYTVKGDAVLIRSPGGPNACPNIYFTYQSQCEFNTETMVLKEHTRFLKGRLSGTYTHYTLSTTMKCSADPWINTHASCTVQSFSGILLNALELGWIKSQLPFGSRVLSASSRQAFLNQIIQQAKALEILAPEKNHAYPADHGVLISVRQNIPADIAGTALERGTQAMVRLVNVDDSKNRMSKIIPLMATGLGLKSFTLPMGHWKVQAYVYSPYQGDVSSAEWREFWVGTGAPPTVSDYMILTPPRGQLVSGNLFIKILFPPNKGRPGIMFLTVNWIPPEKPGQWPEPVDSVFEKEYEVGHDAEYHPSHFQTTIPKSMYFNKHKDGKYQIIAKIYPLFIKGNPEISKNNFLVLTREFYAGEMSNLVHHTSQMHTTKAMSGKITWTRPLGLRTKYTTPAQILVQIKHPERKRIVCQFQQKPSKEKSFKQIVPPSLKKRAGKSSTIWTLTIKKAGTWRVRFKPKDGKKWGKWHTFEVMAVKKSSASQKISHRINAPVLVSPRQSQRIGSNGKVFLEVACHSLDLEFQFEHKLPHSSSTYKKMSSTPIGLTISNGRVRGTALCQTGDWRVRVREGGQKGTWCPWRFFHVAHPLKRTRKFNPKPPSGQSSKIKLKPTLK